MCSIYYSRVILSMPFFILDLANEINSIIYIASSSFFTYSYCCALLHVPSCTVSEFTLKKGIKYYDVLGFFDAQMAFLLEQKMLLHCVRSCCCCCSST